MKKLARIIINHIQGKQTKTSQKLMNKISKKLKEAGYKPPFKLKIASVTFSPENNYDYSAEHGLYDEDTMYEPEDLEQGEENPVFKIPHFTLNVANGNFEEIVKGIGLPFESEDDWMGKIHPDELLKLIRSATMRERESSQEENVFHGGMPAERFLRYLNELEKIAEEALRRNEFVVWY